MPIRFRPDYPIVTERLHLRPHREEDLDDLVAFHSDPEVVRYIPWPVRDREQTRVALDLRLTREALYAEGDWLIMAVELIETGQVVGELLLKWRSEEHQQGEIGFALNAAFQGRGLGREAASAVLDYGFDVMGLHRIVGICDARNTASAGLLAALGMRREGLFRDTEFFKGEWTDEYVFAILADEWRSLRASS